MFEVKHDLRVLPVFVINQREDKEKEVLIGEEFESLIDTLGGVIVERVIQKSIRTNKRTFIGKGKVDEISYLISKHDIDVVMLSETIKPGQIHELKTVLQTHAPKVEVWDRVDLILHIFSKHAHTTEAKLQIELARMRYMGPRIYGMGYVMSRQGGGIGTSGVGETNTELMKRHWRQEIKKVEDKISKLTTNRENQLDIRRRKGFRTISIVGYTNAGKSSLFNLLSGKDVLTENALFATLDSSVSKMYYKNLDEEVLITDTIGFIRNLPPLLIRAFESTLLETVNADILLHVIDISDPEMDEKIRVVNTILKDIQTESNKVLYVFNKIDKVSTSYQETVRKVYSNFPSVFISVKDERGKVGLLEQIEVLLKLKKVS